ncbi:MAG: hypothetical protein Q9177_001700 [Variospora cf. flavescens]
MSSSGTAALLYAAVSPASVTGAVPEEAKDKRHHLKDGKGFTNPWDSWIEMGGFSIGWAMAKNYRERKVARHHSSYRACPQAKLLYVA